jgi:predicted dehydrogenase
MNKKVHIGILGCANFVKRYGIPSFKAIDNAEIVGIASRDIAKATAWAKEYGIPEAYDSYDALIASDTIDAVHVPLPNSLHKEYILKAVRAGKHVICEKSLAVSYKDAQEIVQACKEHGVVLFENFMCGYHPQHQAVRSLIDEGKLGAVSVFRSFFGFPKMNADNIRYNKDLAGGVLNENGAYTLFMARSMVGKEPISVTTTLYSEEVDIRGTITLDFGDGVTALLAFDLDAVYQNNYSIWGSKGIIHVNRAYSIPGDMKPDIECVTNENMQEKREKIDAPAVNHFELIFSDFCDTILHKESRADNREDKYQAILAQAKALECARISARENRKVLLSEYE